MASDHIWPVLGTVAASFGDLIEVAHDPASGDLRIGLSGPAALREDYEGSFAWLDAAARDQLRELLDRAAMPGQVTT